MTIRSLINPAAEQELETLRRQLIEHPLYGAVRDVPALRVFMQQHVFAVWDFMSLLKRLQREATCVELPWQPAASPESCRFITEILLAEECDEDGRGGYASHFELYLAAMREVDAETSPIERFLDRLANGATLSVALDDPGILPATRVFVTYTINLAQRGEPWTVAAAFFHGREDVIPDMFARLVTQLERDGLCVDRFLHYLRRHIEVDGDHHGPLADRLLQQLCQADPQRELEALQTACESLQHRLRLWDGIFAALPT